MSVFDDQTKGDETKDQATDDQTTTTSEDWVSKLAETRGEKWKDPQVIAKGKFEADQHIENLEKQLAEMREDLAKNSYAEQVLAALKDKGQTPNGDTSESKNDKGDESTQNTTDAADVDIESLVEQTLTKREKEQAIARNVEQVSSHLEQEFGTEAASIVKQKADELGMSLDRLKDMAGESPKAFLALVGSAPLPERNADVSSSVNSQAVAQTRAGTKNWKYYQDMRRKNPNQYYKPSVQNEMVKMREQMGDSFYN